MKRAVRRALFLVEEGAAFDALEGRRLGLSRKDQAMNTHTQQATNEAPHFAPVDAWDAIAAGYDMHVAPGEATLATQALKLARLSAGQRFLDVAAGPGGLALPAARLGARVVATDWSRAM